MGNSYFQCKQFRVEQQHAAMKVSTDACIQGAWTPATPHATQALDIGCGTGLLSLMLAQRYPHLTIDAVEIDVDAAMDAAHNFRASPWAQRINLLTGDARTILPAKQYHLIICNPPFFNNSLLGPSESRNTARHTISLTHASLAALLVKHLAAAGLASVLLPVSEYELWQATANKEGLHLQSLLAVQPKEGKPANRIIALYALQQLQQPLQHTLTIYQPDGSYTPAAVDLLAPFYLKL